MTPEVSVLLPTHGRADVLGYAVQSVLAQSFGDFELLIVGDGCTDVTRDVVAGFTDSRIRWFDLTKAPLSGYANRNTVLRQATGRVVAYAQDDDLWFPDHLDLLLSTLDGDGVEWAYSRPLWVGSDGVICPSTVNLTLSDEREHFLDVENSIPSSCVMHLRAALERVGYWPEDQARTADWVCWRRIIRSAATLAAGYCPVPTSLHFRAIWRDFDSVFEYSWHDPAQQPWWPPALLRPPGAEIEQAILWRAMSTDGDWIKAVRRATRAVLDRMAWSACSELLPAIATANAEGAAATADASHVRAEARTARLATEDAKAECAASRADACHARVETRQACQEAETARLLREVAELRCGELEEQRDAAMDASRLWEATAAAAAARAERDHAALQTILVSTTWRATAPMRAAIDALKNLAGSLGSSRSGG